ncbi:MAG: SWIM zinc finger family protein [Acidimicrobiales bacterium]
MSGNYKTKALAYLAEGRVTVISITPTTVTANVKGAGEIYIVTAGADGWRCTCPAKGPCCHIWATQLVAVKPSRP